MFGKTLYNFSPTDNVEELFLGNPSHLKHVIQWKHNRPPDMDRVAEIKQYIQRTKRVDGIIYLAELNIDGKITYVCYDGNHRRLALADAQSSFQVLIHVLWNASDALIRERFVNINKANPVPELYLDDSSHNEHLKVLIQDVVHDVCKLFPSHVSTSKCPKRPNFNRDVLTEKLWMYFKERSVYEFCPKSLIKQILNLNIRYMQSKSITSKLSEIILKKCRQNRCFLFLKNFIDDLEV